MSDGIRLLQWRHKFDAREYDAMKRAGATESVIHRAASRALADRIIRDAAFQVREEKPDPDDPWGGSRATITFSVPIGDRGEAGKLAAQLERARAEGMRDAAEVARATAARFYGKDGMCAGVIASALADAAREIERKAAERLAALSPHQETEKP